MPRPSSIKAEPALVEEYLKYLAFERGLSPNTCSAYASDLRQFCAYLAGRAPALAPLAVTHEQLDDYLWELKSKKGLSAPSLFRKIEALKSFYAFQAAERRIERNPAENFRSPRLNLRLPRYLSEEETQRLLNAPSDGSFETVRAQTMVEMLYATGMRISELIALKAEYVNLEDGWVRVFGKGSKERLIPIHDRAKAALRRYLGFRKQKFSAGHVEPEIFLSRRGRKLSRVQFWRDLNAMGKRAGIKTSLHPHLIRHTFATHLLGRGADLRSVQELLGHAGLATTQIYTHLEKSGLKASHQKNHPRA